MADELLVCKPDRQSMKLEQIFNSVLDKYPNGVTIKDIDVLFNPDYAGYYSLMELENSVYLFTFKYKVSKEALLMDERFMTGTFGGELAISLKG